jgi:site-specific DNA-methyltransferase (adenine-specific)
MNIKPWPELLEVLPPLSAQEYGDLKKSIETYGVLNSILILPGRDNDGRIIDGYHRWKIAGGDTPYTCLNLDERSAFLLGLAINVSRRQMSPDQIKELRQRQKKIALELRKIGKSQEEVAAIVGVTQQTIDKWEGGNITTGCNISTPDLRIKVAKADHQNIYRRVKSGELQAQVAADYKITRRRVSQIVQSVEKAKKSSQRRGGLAEAGPQLVAPAGIKIDSGDFRKLANDIPSDSIDLIFTDPNYAGDYLDLWEPLAELAARVLKPGRFLLAYCGKLYLPYILDKLGKHLEYYWIAGKYYDQGHSFFRSRKIWDQWRPILIYQKPGPTEHEWFLDMIRMGSREEAKELHDYGQSIEDAKYYIQKLTVPGEVVLDVCCGAGTILVAAKQTGRKAIGFDVDESLTRIAKSRLAEVVNQATKVS